MDDTPVEVVVRLDFPDCDIWIRAASRPHHLKIDVGAMEDRGLAGAPNTLRSETLQTVLIEVDEVKWTGVPVQPG